MRDRVSKIFLFSFAVIIFLMLPLVADRFYVQFASKILVMIIFASSLNLLVGYCGLVSLGHAAFFGFSGYVLALISPTEAGVNFMLGLLASVLGAACLAAIIGSLVIRTKGIFFIMATLAFGEMLFYFFHDTNLAGGSDGIYINHRPVLDLVSFSTDFSNANHFYFLALISTIITVVFLRILLKSPFGKTIVGIHINEHRMRAIGYETYLHKLICFVIAGGLAGLAGFLSAIQFGAVNPEMMGWHLSGHVLMMVIFGGLGTLTGPALGAFSLMVLEECFQVTTKHWQLMIGIVIVVVALGLPKGIAGFFQRTKSEELG